MALEVMGCSARQHYDVLIRGGTIYDGTGSPGFVGDVGVRGDRIALIGDAGDARGDVEIDATGRAVSPGFINMLSWANEALLVDGRGMSDLKQGVTLEVMGEGHSMGPLNAQMKADMVRDQGDIRFDVTWTTLGEYLDHLAERGVALNVASFVGATTLREHEIGYENRAPTADELARMQALVRQAMEEGAMGVSSSLIYSPAFYAKTDELIALARAAAEYAGLYTSHIRNEGDSLYEAFDEFLTIAREAGIRAELYHMKASGRANWDKLDGLFERIEAARAAGLHVTADIYTYHASATGLDAIMPPWVQEGGPEAWRKRLEDPQVRARVRHDMNTPSQDWDNGYLTAGSPDNILLVGFKNPKLKPLTGKTLGEVARMRGTEPEYTAMDLVVEDASRIDCVFFSMSEENIRKKVRQPWVSVCSDAEAIAPEGDFLKRSAHPRAYGSFIRMLGKFCRDEKLITLEDAVHRMSGLPAENLKLHERGLLKEGYHADIVVFDPARVADRATFEKPHQYAVGVEQVFVNGTQVLEDGAHTGAFPGRVVRGPGWSGWQR
ncbi:MAG TPA: D-aminoacylase [Phycisphaerae bacterium]|nr:D-aminoacylase [Phycisphaerales bacterium]HRX84069.1 D-aminoacylase [Phycisphaerae bacterium]